MEKIKAMHVVIPGGIKFMKFLLKVIALVVNETVAGKKTTIVEVKKPVGEYICKDLVEKSEFVTALGVELKKIVADDVAEIKKKTEIIDTAIKSVFADVIKVEAGDRKYLFDSWTKANLEKFNKMQEEQKDMRKAITAFDRICKQGKNLLKPQEFEQSRYYSEGVKESIRIIKDKTGYVDESEELATTAYGYTNMVEVIKLIKISIEPVITTVIKYPPRNLNDIKADAVVVNELFTKVMSVSSEVKAFMKRFSDDASLHTKQVSLQNIVCDHQLLNGFFGTPPIAINTKESEDMSMIHMPFGRIGNRDATRMNFSHSKALQISQRELIFSPKLEKSIFVAPKPGILLKPLSRPNKRHFQINSASLFATNDTRNVSRLESYSMVMPGSANVFSSTVLDQSIRNHTPPSVGLNHVGKPMSACKSTGTEYSFESPLNETQIPKILPGGNTPRTSMHHLTPQPKRLSINAILSPKIQLNDRTITSPNIHSSLSSHSHMKSSSPSSRIKVCPGRPMLSTDSLSTNSNDSSYNNLTKRTLVMGDTNVESPNTLDVFTKFTNMNLGDEKENLFNISETMLVNDSM